MITREQWLTKAAKALNNGLFKRAGYSVPSLRVSVGFPSRRASGKRMFVGQCFSTKSAADGVSQVFIHPMLDKATKVIEVLAHEMVHVLDNCEHKHGAGGFIEPAKAIGLVKPWTATTASTEMVVELHKIADKLGEYPHSALNIQSGIKKQTTRLRKWICPGECGLIVRVAKDDLNLMCLNCDEVLVQP